MCVGSERKVAVSIEMRPRDAAVFGRPIAVDILGRDVLHPESLHRRRGRLGAEGRNAQAVHVVTLKIGKVGWIGHHRFQERDPGLENRDIVPFNHRSEAPRMREHGRPFRYDGGYTRHKRCADQVALACDPAGIGNNEQRVAGSRVERHFHRVCDARSIAVGVNDAFRFARRTRGVDEEHRIISINGQWL